MRTIDEPVERLITRALDGELTETERAALDAALAADPAIRRLFEEYRRIDRHAREALRAVCVSDRTVVAQIRSRRGLWLATAAGVFAAAAVLLLTVGPRLMMPPPGTSHDPIAENVGGTHRPLPITRVDDRRPPEWTAPVREGPGARLVEYVEKPVVHPRNLDRRMTSDWIGVVDDSGDKVYLMEITRGQTKIVPVSGDY